MDENSESRFLRSQHEQILELRRSAGDLLSSKYDTDFNLLRWIQGYREEGFEAAKLMFLRHLKLRRFFDLDNVGKQPDDFVTSTYFPLGLVGKTGTDNKFLVVEAAGRIDLSGFQKSIQISAFLRQRFKFQELLLENITNEEKLSGNQSGVVHILDLDGLRFESDLISAVTGPYLILWGHIMLNYPELISKIIVINAPSFMPLLWKALCPFIPELTRRKIEILSSRDCWQSVVLRYVRFTHLPLHWGGTLADPDGDSMCRSRIVVPMGKIPKELFWKPNQFTPSAEKLKEIAIGAGKTVQVNFDVLDANCFLVLHKFCLKTYSMAILYCPNDEQTNEWCPEAEYPGMITVDTLKVKTPGKGVFKFRFSNQNSWFRPLSFRYSIAFVDHCGKLCKFREVSSS